MKKKILILGGGFAGVEAAIKASKSKHEVTLISSRDYLFIYPISIWIPVGKKSFDDVKLPLQKLSNRYKFNVIIDEVKTIDSRTNTVSLGSSNISYDYLIIAFGMSKFSLTGIENTLSICGNPEESVSIYNKLQSLISKGSGSIAVGFGGNPNDSTATSVRGGPAFELLFNLSHYLKSLGLRKNFQITFFAPMKEPGKKMGKNAFGKLNSFFTRYGILTRIGEKITGFNQSEVQFEDGSVLESDMIIYIPGGAGHPVIADSGLPANQAGFAIIDNNCLVEGKNNIYAVGDVAALEGPAWTAKQGHIAEVMADAAVYNILNHIDNKPERRGYQEHLNIVCVMDTGDGAAFVYRDKKRELLIPMPIVGHWLKKGWGFYYRNSKLGRIPRIPGM